MYTLGVRREFIARHFLIGGNWGQENFPNSHHYILELQLEGAELDQHGYLVDIVDVEKHLDEVVGYYKEQMLNDKPEFAGLNPSRVEHERLVAVTRPPEVGRGRREPRFHPVRDYPHPRRVDGEEAHQLARLGPGVGKNGVGQAE